MEFRRSELSIEPMILADLDAVVSIDQSSFPSPWRPAAFATELGNRAAYYLVARVRGELVGFAGAWVKMGECHVTTLAVAPSCRRRGIGARLLEALLQEAVLRGAEHAALEVRESNAAARALYAGFGFRESAVWRDYYTDASENAIVMWADDLSPREPPAAGTHPHDEFVADAQDR